MARSTGPSSIVTPEAPVERGQVVVDANREAHPPKPVLGGLLRRGLGTNADRGARGPRPHHHGLVAHVQKPGHDPAARCACAPSRPPPGIR